MTDFRALITEMADALDHDRQCLMYDSSITHPLADKARAALAEGETVGGVPSMPKAIEDLPEQQRRWYALGWRTALSRYASAPRPIPVGERLPGAEDCDAHGWCWVLYRGFHTWTLQPPFGQDGLPDGWSHWLPAHALPIPTQENADVQ